MQQHAVELALGLQDILLIQGPPGTGKSLAAKVTASVLGVPLVRLDFGKVFSKYVGDSESRIRSAWAVARRIDEAGSMAAIFAASEGADTLLIEGTRDGGRKILISGGTPLHGEVAISGAKNAVLPILAGCLLAALTYWVWRLRSSPFGMTLRAGRQNARRVMSVGLALRNYQLTAYVLSAVLCGVAGILLANLNAYASPSSMSWMVSGELIVMVVLGGLGSVFGPLLGALTFFGVEELLKAYTEHWMALFGLAILAVAMLGRTGLMGWLERFQPASSRDAVKPGSAGQPLKEAA